MLSTAAPPGAAAVNSMMLTGCVAAARATETTRPGAPKVWARAGRRARKAVSA
jgi:hypothetical protein